MKVVRLTIGKCLNKLTLKINLGAKNGPVGNQQ